MPTETFTTAEELSEVMVGHFERAFTVPPVDPLAPLALDPPDMLFTKPSVDPDWFGGLMDEPTEDELLDLLYTIFYDIKQAYDSVQREPLERAMRRLRLPPPFIRLVIDSLTDLTSCIRTIYGITRRFVVERSLRQGDPLAPLLFIILMDALHDGLENNPFTGRQHGCRLTHSTGSHSISSVGYADDTGIIVSTLADLAVQNNWVQYFMRFSLLRLNPLKCELVGRASDGSAITPAGLARHDFLINGVAPIPVDHARSIRYLGVHSRDLLQRRLVCPAD